MDTLERNFKDEIKKQFSFHKVGTEIINQKLLKKGISLQKNELSKISKELQKIEENPQRYKCELANGQLVVVDIPECDRIEINIDDFNNEILNISKRIDEKLIDILNIVVETGSQSLIFHLKKKAPKMLNQRRRVFSSFQGNLYKDWSRAFDLYEMFINIAYDVGDEFNKDFRKNISIEDQFLIEVLTRLHARACQISHEILVLMQNGYADGAYARWRTMHEIAVMGAFISSNGNELAEKYLLHDNIESYKAALQYQKFYEQLGYPPIPDDELKNILSVYEELLLRFGNNFKNEYGWASSIVNKNNPRFSDIEEITNMNYLRPFYRLASHNVHANPKGVMYKIGLIDNNRNILLAGPTNTGFTEAARGTLISLGNITVQLITQRPNIDYLIVSNCLLKLIPEISDEFFKVDEVIKKRSLN